MIAVDSSVLIDVIGADAKHGPASLRALERALEQGTVIACEIVFAETAACFSSADLALETLDTIGIVFSPMSAIASVRAGEVWRTCRSSGGGRRRVIADILIGAHASSEGVPLLTRDRGFYGTLFSDLEVLAP